MSQPFEIIRRETSSDPKPAPAAPRVTFKSVDEVQEFLDEAIPDNYFIKLNTNVEDSRLMLKLDKRKLRRIQKAWEQNPDGLQIGQFVKLMMSEIRGENIEEKLQNMQGFIKYFQSVDINGDGNMEWSELIQQIIDTVTTESIKRHHDVNGKPVEIQQILQEMDQQQFSRYMRNSKMDKGSHKKKIVDAIFCEEEGNGSNKKHTQKVIHSEENSNILGVYSTDLKLVKKIDVPVKLEKAVVTSLCFRDMSNNSSVYGPVGTTSLIAVTCTDNFIHIFVQVKGRIEYWKSVPSLTIQDRIWCTEHSKHFISAGKHDFKLRQWNFSPFVSNALVGEIGEKNEKGEIMQLHTSNVTDVVEILNPASIITCSLDKTIKMFNMDRGVLMRTFTMYHHNGIKQLIYVPGFNRLLSRGYEIFINVWNPENLYGDPHMGHLRGHKKPVVTMDSIKGQAYVVTMDQEGDIIIWDVRTHVQMQNIKSKITKPMNVHGVFCFDRKKIWLFGTRFFELEKELSEEANYIEHRADDVIPLNAFYNQFFNQICVMTSNQLKLYNAEDGRLAVLHMNLFKQAHESQLVIAQDARHRKVYVASSQGRIQVMNVQSGVVLHQVLDDEKIDEIKNSTLEQQSAYEKSQPRAIVAEGAEGQDERTFITSVKESHSKHPQGPGFLQNEIVDIQLIWEEDLIQLIYCDRKSIYIYNELDPEESDLLRTMTGANLDDNITKLKFDMHLMLIATGSDKGRVAVWDYEIGKLLGFCNGHDEGSEITAIEFCSPYPIMLTCATDGRLMLWTVRPVIQQNCYICVASFNNMTFNGQNEEITPIQSISVYQGNMPGIERGFQLFHYQLPATTYREYQTTQVLAMQEESITKDKHGNPRGQFAILNERVKLLQEYQQKDRYGFSKTELEFSKLKKDPPFRSVKSEFLTKEYDFDVNTTRERYYVYTGDWLGYIKLWDLTGVLAKCGFGKVPSFIATKPSFVATRKGVIDVCDYSQKLLKQSETAKITIPNGQLSNGILIREVHAHTQPVKKLSQSEQGGVISCSGDLNVNVWSNGLDLVGILNQKSNALDPLWNFQTSCAHQKVESELKQMQDLIEEVGLKDEVGMLVADDQLKEHAECEEGMTQTLSYLQCKQQKIIQALEDKKEQRIALREKEKQEWVNMMQGDKKNHIEAKAVEPFNIYKFKIQQIGEFVKKLDEEEQKYLDPAVLQSIEPRKDFGLVKKINDKLEGIIQEEIKQRQLQKQLRESMAAGNLRESKARRQPLFRQSKVSLQNQSTKYSNMPQMSPGKSINLSQLQQNETGSRLNESLKSPLRVSQMTREPSVVSPTKITTVGDPKSPLRTSQEKLPAVEKRDRDWWGEEKTIPHIVLQKVPTNTEPAKDLPTHESPREKRGLEDLNRTQDLDVKMKKSKKDKELNPQVLERDREKIKQLKNMPSLRAALESIKTTRQKVLLHEQETKMKAKTTVGSAQNLQRNQSKRTMSIATEGLPYGFTQENLREPGLLRNDSLLSSAIDQSVRKFLRDQKSDFDQRQLVGQVSSKLLSVDRGQYVTSIDSEMGLLQDSSTANLIRAQQRGLSLGARGGLYTGKKEGRELLGNFKSNRDSDQRRLITQEDMNLPFLPSIQQHSYQEHNPYFELTQGSVDMVNTLESQQMSRQTAISGNERTPIVKRKDSIMNEISNIRTTDVSQHSYRPGKQKFYIPKDQSMQSLEVNFHFQDTSPSSREVTRKEQPFQSTRVPVQRKLTNVSPKALKRNATNREPAYIESRIIQSGLSDCGSQKSVHARSEAKPMMPLSNYMSQRAQSYTIRKEKYTGENSIMMQIAKREAENIRKQRERIAELKEFTKVV